jgi:hypothetical protein
VDECKGEGQLELELKWPSGHAPDYYEKLMGKTVRCTVPVEFWSDHWHDGMREYTFVGTLCGHHEGGWCLQPPPRAQGISKERGQCFLVTNTMKFEVLPGRPEDY